MAEPFQAFTIKISGIADRILTKIAVSEAVDLKNPPTPLPKTQQTVALWDTGASKSVISSGIVNSLGLVPVGKSLVRHAGGQSESLTYMVNFQLPNGVVIGFAMVTELGKHEGGFDVIVGMDVISLGDFSITNVRGQTCMSFRTPSCATIDYVEQRASQ